MLPTEVSLTLRILLLILGAWFLLHFAALSEWVKGRNFWLIATVATSVAILIELLVSSWPDISAWLSSTPDHPPIITQLFGPLVAFIALIITGLVTYSGWKVALQNSYKAEEQRNRNSVELEKLKVRRQFVNDQLQHLYGPLLALCNARKAAFREMTSLVKPDGKHFFDGTKLKPDQLRQWRLWRREVFLPILMEMQNTILKTFI